MTGFRRLAVAMIASGLLGIGSLTAPAGLFSSAAGADTDPTTLVGQGGSFFEPVISKLLADDSANINPLFGSYLLTDNDSGIAAFVGSGPGQFTDDFAVSERPLTASEAATAATDGRSYAYVPIASTPVALATLVPTTAWANSGDTAITSSDFCQHMPLTTTLLGDIFGFDSADPLHNWNDTRITCPQAGGSGTTADGLSVALWANLDPSMSNYAMMSLLDSDPTSQALFAAGLAGSGSLTTDTSPSELWPYAQNTIPGGDEPLLGKLLAINSESNAPSTQATTWQLGAIAPISSVWTGAPLGVSWDLPTAAIQNAQGAFVAPSLASAQAAAADATLSATSNPTTNNLVTFNASSTDADAYNSDLMEETYLVVPLNGLSSTKASALAQVVRFILGPQGQQDIESFGAAPATSAMQAAGLKVAAQLSAESVTAANPSVAGTTTTSTTSASGAAATATGASGGTSSVGAASDGSGSDSDGSSSDSGLAFTGTADLGAWIGAGVFLLLVGTMLRRLFRRREAQ